MDFCLLNDGKEDLFVSALRSRLEGLGPSVWLNRETSFSDQLSAIEPSILSKPFVLVLDLGKEKLKHWDMPLYEALQSRIFGGIRLPRNSSVIILSESSESEVYSLKTDSLNWLCHLMDVHTEVLEKDLLSFFSKQSIDEFRMKDFKERLANIVVTKIEEERANPSFKTKMLQTGHRGEKGLVEPDAMLSRPLKERVMKKLKHWVNSTYER